MNKWRDLEARWMADSARRGLKSWDTTPPELFAERMREFGAVWSGEPLPPQPVIDDDDYDASDDDIWPEGKT